MVYHNPFDLYYWLVNVFAGNLEIFLAIAFLVIGSITAMFRMPPIITGLMFSIFIVMLAAYTGNLVILVIVIIALIIGWGIARLFK